MTGWTRASTSNLIADGVLEIGDGYRAKNSEFVPSGGLAFVRVGDVRDHINLEVSDQLPTSLSAVYGRKISKPKDCLITMKGTVGRVAYVRAAMPPFVYSPQIAYWRSLDHSVINPRWLRYWLESPEFVRQTAATKGSTDMADYVNLRDQRQMEISLPSPDVQRRIAHILGSIDDLIENNRRRVEVLEEMARAIYREWFVKFRYPGHEDVPLVDSPLGRIPEGWVVSRLGAIVDFTMGQSPKSEFYNVQGNGLPFHQGVADFGRHFPTTRKWCSVQGRSALAGDVLVSVRAPVGRINVADTEMTIGRGLAALRAKDGRQALLLERLRETFEVEDSLGNDGAIFKSLGRAEFVSIPVLVPTDAVADAANAILTDNLGSIRALSHSIQRLTELRDLLLPKLVTGQIDVSTLDLDALISSTSSQKEMAS